MGSGIEWEYPTSFVKYLLSWVFLTRDPPGTVGTDQVQHKASVRPLSSTPVGSSGTGDPSGPFL